MNVLMNLLKKTNIIPVPLADVQPQMCRARVILEANQLGVFTAIEKERRGLTASELAERVGIAPDAAEILLNALYYCGYLRRWRKRYRNGRWVKRWILDPRTGISHHLLLQLHGWQRLSELEAVLRTGRPVKDYHALEVAASSEEQEIYTQAMREMARFLMPDFIKRVVLPAGAKRMLDLGGAHGDYSRAVIGKYPGLEATVFDLPGPIATAEKIAEKEGNPEGLRFLAGDIFEDDIGQGWDAVLLANIVHLFDPEQNRRLFARIYQSLNPGGVVLVMDQFMGISRFHNKICSLIALSYFTVGGKCYERKQMKAFLRDSGFERVKIKPFVLRAPTVLIEAWK